MFVGWITQYGYVALFVLLMLGIVGVPFPDDLILAFAGYLVSAGHLAMFPTIAFAFLGSLCGITVSYALGRLLGFSVIEKYGHHVHVTTERLNRVQCWYERFGKWTLVIGYFIGGVRHGTAFTAGVSRLRLPVFAVFAYSGGLMWSVTLVSAGYFLGEEWSTVAEHAGLPVLIAVCMATAAGLFLAYSWIRRRFTVAC